MSDKNRTFVAKALGPWMGTDIAYGTLRYVGLAAGIPPGIL